MNFDKVLDDLGEFGKWQKINLFLLWFPFMMCGVVVLLGSFTLLQPTEYRCKIEDCDVDGFQFDDFEKKWEREEFFPCYGRNSDRVSDINYKVSVRSAVLTDTDHCSGVDEFCVFLKPMAENGRCLSNLTNDKVFCNSESEFVYKEFQMTKTIISEFNMVCDKILKEINRKFFFSL